MCTPRAPAWGRLAVCARVGGRRAGEAPGSGASEETPAALMCARVSPCGDVWGSWQDHRAHGRAQGSIGQEGRKPFMRASWARRCLWFPGKGQQLVDSRWDQASQGASLPRNSTPTILAERMPHSHTLGISATGLAPDKLAGHFHRYEHTQCSHARQVSSL